MQAVSGLELRYPLNRSGKVKLVDPVVPDAMRPQFDAFLHDRGLLVERTSTFRSFL